MQACQLSLNRALVAVCNTLIYCILHIAILTEKCIYLYLLHLQMGLIYSHLLAMHMQNLLALGRHTIKRLGQGLSLLHFAKKLPLHTIFKRIVPPLNSMH